MTYYWTVHDSATTSDVATGGAESLEAAKSQAEKAGAAEQGGSELTRIDLSISGPSGYECFKSVGDEEWKE